jgi:hypothetical protein
MMCARLVALKSPVLEFTVTLLKSMFALTDVKRTSQSLPEHTEKDPISKSNGLTIVPLSFQENHDGTLSVEKQSREPVRHGD